MRYNHSQVRGLNSRARVSSSRARFLLLLLLLFYISSYVNYSRFIFSREIGRGEKSCAILNYARLFLREISDRRSRLQPVATVFDYRAGTIFLSSLMADAAAQIRMTEGGCRDSSTLCRLNIAPAIIPIKFMRVRKVR